MFLKVQLDQGDSLNQFPRDSLREQIPRLGVLLPHDKPHFLGLAPPAGPAHPLKEGGNGKRRVDLESPFQLSDVNSKLQRRGRTGCDGGVLLFHRLLRGLAEGNGQIAVMNHEAVRLVRSFAVLAERGGDSLALLPGIAEYQAFSAFCMFKDIGHPRICAVGRSVRRLTRSAVAGNETFPAVRKVCRLRAFSCRNCRIRHPEISPGHSGFVHCLNASPGHNGFVRRLDVSPGRRRLVRRLRRSQEKMLHGEAPAQSFCLNPRDHAAPPRSA